MSDVAKPGGLVNPWIKKALFSAFVLCLSLSAKAAVWKEVNQWDDSWEQKYSSWIQSEFNEDIYGWKI